MTVDVSVIICCYNSTTRINETLRYLRAQNAKVLWEIVLVDNASTDGTAERAKKIWSEQPQPATLIIVEEPQPGLSHARAAGVKAAAGPIVIFCDDDNWLDAGYVALAHKLMMDLPDAGIVGGWCHGAFEIPLPQSLVALQGALSIGKHINGDREVTAVFGAGMVMRKKCFEAITEAGASLLHDRKGKILSSGGDTEMCHRAAFARYKVRFSEGLHFIHFMPKERLNKRYILRLCLRDVGDRITLWAYDAIRRNNSVGFLRFSFEFILSMLGKVFYALPRIILGRHRFHSVITFLQAWKLIGLIILRGGYYSLQFRHVQEIRLRLGSEKQDSV